MSATDMARGALDGQLEEARAALVSGRMSLPLSLGFKPAHRPALPAHFERGEQACYQQALAQLHLWVGGAARVVAWGSYSSAWLGPVLDVLERPKAGIVLAQDCDAKHLTRLTDAHTTAEISFTPLGATDADWGLPEMGTGTTLMLVGGLGFALLSHDARTLLLQHASAQLATGDQIAISLEGPRDAAALEADYKDWAAMTVSQALAQIGRAEGLEPRLFYDPAHTRLRISAIAQAGASMTWNSQAHTFPSGAWLDFGAVGLCDPTGADAWHSDFTALALWRCAVSGISLVLLRKG